MVDRKLCIFDYHGTLVWAWEIHDEAYSRTVKELFGVDGSLNDVYSAASTIQEVTAAIALQKGVPAETIEEKRDLIVPTHEKYFRAALETGELEVLPGVTNLLNGLEEGGAHLALYTGESFNNTSAVLRKAGLDRYFLPDMRSCGSSTTPDRKELLELAIRKAETKYGGRIKPHNIYLFDDSARGLQSGNDLGIVTVGVATGPEEYETLLGCRPTHLFRDFSDYKKASDVVLSGKA